MQEIFLKDYTEPDFTIKTVDLKFELFEEYTTVESKMVFEKQKDVQELVLNAVELELLEVRLDGDILDETRFSIDEEHLIVTQVPSCFTLEIKNKIYPQNNTELEGLYKSGAIFCTQCEPEGFRKITPYLDRPDVMSVYTTTVVADKEHYPILLSNGNKLQCFDSFDGRHAVTWHDPHPKPSYLFALVAGDLDVLEDDFTTMSGKSVALNIYVDKGNRDKAHHAMRSLKNAMKWDEEKYGREYDLDIYNIVAVDSFNMGAMENKGLNIFNSAYVLADSDTATDANFMGIESVIAHEYFHNWTGNRITCKNWFQLTLKEGLTVFRDQCFSADMNSCDVQRIEDVKALRERQFVEDASPTAHPIQPKSYISMNNFYTATVYEKGAEVIRMIHTLLGEGQYKKGCDVYFQTFDGQAVTTEDFLWAMREGGAFDVEHFKLWYDQSGTPKLKVSHSYKDGVFTLTLKQHVPDTVDGRKQKPLYYPLKVAFLMSNGTFVREEMLIVSKEEEIFVFEEFASEPILSLNRDFSAPIIVEYGQSDERFLMQHDTNGFTKYEAAQNFALDTLFDYIQNKAGFESYLDAYEKLLDFEGDLSYKALLLELPTVSAIMQRQEVIDFEPLYEAKEALELAIAQRFENKLTALYKEHHNPQASGIDAENIGKRALKNRVLKLLSVLKSQEIEQLAHKQYTEATTMTDTIAALDVLESLHPENNKEVFADFYSRYKNNTLVMNKYFALLASSHHDGLLERVEELERDEVYDEKVPNLVRSLIGSYARNYKHFHAKDGSGYNYLAKKIIELDKLNPQMASALSGAFKLYPRMNECNKNVMKKALEMVIAEKNISKNTYEIIHKILK